GGIEFVARLVFRIPRRPHVRRRWCWQPARIDLPSFPRTVHRDRRPIVRALRLSHRRETPGTEAHHLRLHRPRLTRRAEHPFVADALRKLDWHLHRPRSAAVRYGLLLHGNE